MNYREVSPGDIILIYGEMKRVERVDRTHLATRGPRDSLELWGWGEDHLDFIFRENKLHLKSLGFIERGDSLILNEVEWFTNHVYINSESDKYMAYCNTLNELQKFYYKHTGKELNIDLC